MTSQISFNSPPKRTKRMEKFYKQKINTNIEGFFELKVPVNNDFMLNDINAPPRHTESSNQQRKCIQAEEIYDPHQRKQMIKEKIKNRVKLELSNLLKKNIASSSLFQKATIKTNVMRNFPIKQAQVYVKGRSFSRASRNEESSRKNSVIHGSPLYFQFNKVDSNRIDFSNAKIKTAFSNSPRNWSSVIRIKKVDRVNTNKNKNRSSFSIDQKKLEHQQIQPWSHYEDHDFFLEN